MTQLASLSSPKTSPEDALDLLPSQQAVYGSLLRAVNAAPVVGYRGLPGMGRSTLLRKLAKETGALFLDPHIASQSIRAYPANKWEEVLYDLVLAGLDRNRVVIFDGFPDMHGIRSARGPLFFRVMMRHLRDLTISRDRRLVLGGNVAYSWESNADTFGDAAALISSGPLKAEDYRAFLSRTRAVDGVDFKRLHRAAPMLDVYQLKVLANLLRKVAEPVTTEQVEGLIESRILRTNLHLKEVEKLTFESLPGSEHIAQALETHVVLPFENKALAYELGLKPKRGVLLYGPPGTGKTSIGRALAHRMQGRFFLIDGSFVTEPPSSFFAQIEAVITEAKANAPSLLFIDDADVLFQIEHVAGLSRYLLSLLDGLESESANNVCVMMTAMDARKVPEALLRSGRVELWLETRAPDESTRARILQRWATDGMPGHEQVDYAALASVTAGFTPADLRRVAGDAKLIYAADLARDRSPGNAGQYLSAAVENLLELRSIMARQLAEDSLRTRAYA